MTELRHNLRASSIVDYLGLLSERSARSIVSSRYISKPSLPNPLLRLIPTIKTVTHTRSPQMDMSSFPIHFPDCSMPLAVFRFDFGPKHQDKKVAKLAQCLLEES